MDSASQAAKAKLFNPLQAGSGAFVVANVFDAGSARSSPALDLRPSQPRAAVSRRRSEPPWWSDLEHGFENGFDAKKLSRKPSAGRSSRPRQVHRSCHQRKDQPIYPFDAALERNSDGVEAARSLDFDFKLTGRCENFLGGRYETGATSVDGTGSPRTRPVCAVCEAVSRPFNLGRHPRGKSFYVAEPEAVGGPTHQSGDIAISSGNRCNGHCGGRSSRPRYLRICRNQAADAPSC